jgi:hypothetical protein
MDQHHISSLTRSLTRVPSRRDVWRGLVGAGLGLAVARLPDVSKGKKKGKGKKKSKKPHSKPNAYGCLNVGAACGNDDQCCSGVCEGKTCRAHHAGICRVDSDLCTTGAAHVCNIVGDADTCACVLTTGNAPFCGQTGDGLSCQDCDKDSDCEEQFGPGAACFVLAGVCEEFCAEAGGITACAAPCAKPAK